MIRLKVLNLIVALYVTGCGAEDQGQLATSQVGGKPPSQASQAESTDQKQVVTSLSVTDQKALPSCDTASEGQLAYVKAEKTFYACEGGSWGEIDVRGEKGDQGEVGTKGDTGARGVAGVQGADGKAGRDGQAGATGAKGEVVIAPPEVPAPLAANEWLETVSGLVWTKNTAPSTFDTATIACVRPGYRFPTEEELKLATAVGTLKAPGPYVWSDTGRQARPDAVGIMIDVAPTDKGLAYCVKETP